jgi:hypothetical protein
MRFLAQTILCLTAASALAACDAWKSAPPKNPSSYAACLSERLASAHTAEGAAAVIGACRVEVPPGADLRKLEGPLRGVEVTGRAGLDESYGIARTLSGTLWNASPDNVVTEVKIRLTTKPKPEGKAASAPVSTSTWVYSIPVELWPQSATSFTISIIPILESDFDWGVIAVQGLSATSARALR